MRLLHGTSQSSFDAISRDGLQPSSMTGVSREKRSKNTDRVFLLDGNQSHSLLMAAGYAVRAALRDDSKPIVTIIDVDPADVSLERDGRGRHFDQYTASSILVESITHVINVPVVPTQDAAVTLHKTKPQLL